jgi:hypothetical protein
MLSSCVVNPSDQSSERRTTPCRPKRQLIFHTRTPFPPSESWENVISWWPMSCKTAMWRSGPDWTGSLHLYIIHPIVSSVYGSLQVNCYWPGNWQGGIPSHAMWSRIFSWKFIHVSKKLLVNFDQSARRQILKNYDIITMKIPLLSRWWNFAHNTKNSGNICEWPSLMFKDGPAQCRYLYFGVTILSVHSKSYCRNPFYALLVYYGFLIAGNYPSSRNKPSTCNTHKHTVTKNDAVSVLRDFNVLGCEGRIARAVSDIFMWHTWSSVMER